MSAKLCGVEQRAPPEDEAGGWHSVSPAVDEARMRPADGIPWLETVSLNALTHHLACKRPLPLGGTKPRHQLMQIRRDQLTQIPRDQVTQILMGSADSDTEGIQGDQLTGIHVENGCVNRVEVARWCNGKAFGLAISRSQVQILLEATLRNNLRQVVHTYVPLSPSSITWYRPKSDDALRLGRQLQAWRKVMAAYRRVDDLRSPAG